MRIVIDTNTWVSGLLWRGLPWQLLCLVEEGKVEICTATTMFSELAEVLSYSKLQPRLAELGLTPSELVIYAINLATAFDVPEGEPIVLVDPDDDIFLWCAVVSGAVYVVSGDHHLLDLGGYAGIPILTLRQFFEKEFPEEVTQP